MTSHKKSIEKNGSGRGFTLVEMIVTLMFFSIIMALITGITVPVFRLSSRMRKLEMCSAVYATLSNWIEAEIAEADRILIIDEAESINVPNSIIAPFDEIVYRDMVWWNNSILEVSVSFEVLSDTSLNMLVNIEDGSENIRSDDGEFDTSKQYFSRQLFSKNRVIRCSNMKFSENENEIEYVFANYDPDQPVSETNRLASAANPHVYVLID